METLLLTRSEVERLIDPAALLTDLRAAFRAYSTTPGVRAQRVRASLGDRRSATMLFPGTVAGVPAYTVKVHAKFPDQRPAIRGVLCLHDAHTGDLLAVMDSTHLTAVRTGLAGALAADVLARAGAETVAVIGTGMQGEHQLRSLAMLRPVSRVWAYDTRPEQAQAFAARMAAELRIAVEPRASLEATVREADIILAATWARTPFLFLLMLRQGVHVTTLGADEPGKCEVAAEVMREAVVVCDDRDLAVQMGAVGGRAWATRRSTPSSGRSSPVRIRVGRRRPRSRSLEVWASPSRISWWPGRSTGSPAPGGPAASRTSSAEPPDPDLTLPGHVPSRG